MKRISPMVWSILLVLFLGFGIFAGHRVTSANKDTEIADLQAALEAAQASLAEANVELEFWQQTLKGLAEGDQFKEGKIK